MMTLIRGIRIVLRHSYTVTRSFHFFEEKWLTLAVLQQA